MSIRKLCPMQELKTAVTKSLAYALRYTGSNGGLTIIRDDKPFMHKAKEEIDQDILQAVRSLDVKEYKLDIDIPAFCYTQFFKHSTQIAMDTRRGAGNIILCSNPMYYLISHHENFVYKWREFNEVN